MFGLEDVIFKRQVSDNRWQRWPEGDSSISARPAYAEEEQTGSLPGI